MNRPVTQIDGTKRWYKNGLCHRDDGPAAELPDGTKHWYKNGELHRDDGPAIENADGSKCWFKNGQLHREDGHAIEHPSGDIEYWLFDREYSYEEWLEQIFWAKVSAGIVK